MLEERPGSLLPLSISPFAMERDRLGWLDHWSVPAGHFWYLIGRLATSHRCLIHF